jgi:hypothetical protein
MTQRTLIPGYCIDTCALIDLWRRHYPPDVFESLWRDIENLIQQGMLTAPQEVLDEIASQDDDLLKWAKRNKNMFEILDQSQTNEVRNIERDFPDLIDPNKETPEADPFIVALAKMKGWAVLTSEKQGTATHPRIPDICRRYGMRCLSLVEFFRELGWKY